MAVRIGRITNSNMTNKQFYSMVALFFASFAQNAHSYSGMIILMAISLAYIVISCLEK